MPVPPHCRLCNDRHWSWEPHKYPKGLEVRGWAKEFVSSRPAAVPVAVDTPPIAKQVVVESFPAEDLDDEGENWVLKECEVCGTEFEAQRKTAKFCKPQCRKLAFKVREASQQKDS